MKFMAMFFDDVWLRERSFQWYWRKYGCYFEVLVQLILKKASDFWIK